MAATLGEQSTSAASNTDIAGINQAEGCAPSTVNDATRGITAMAKGALLAVTSGGAANVQTLTYAPVPTAYVSGWSYPFKAGFTNTASATMNVNGLGAKTMKTINSAGTQALSGGEIIAGGFYILDYDNTDLILRNPTPQEGSWTPVFKGSSTAGTQTYTSQIGRYIRQGNMVTCWLTLSISAKDGTTAGNLQVGGLPFTASTIASMRFAMATAYGGFDFDAGYTQVGGYIDSAAAVIQLIETGDNVGPQLLVAANLTASSQLVGSVTYRIN